MGTRCLLWVEFATRFLDSTTSALSRKAALSRAGSGADGAAVALMWRLDIGGAFLFLFEGCFRFEAGMCLNRVRFRAVQFGGNWLRVNWLGRFPGLNGRFCFFGGFDEAVLLEERGDNGAFGMV